MIVYGKGSDVINYRIRMNSFDIVQGSNISEGGCFLKTHHLMAAVLLDLQASMIVL
jgi:hypothetical protein